VATVGVKGLRRVDIPDGTGTTVQFVCHSFIGLTDHWLFCSFYIFILCLRVPLSNRIRIIVRCARDVVWIAYSHRLHMFTGRIKRKLQSPRT